MGHLRDVLMVGAVKARWWWDQGIGYARAAVPHWRGKPALLYGGFAPQLDLGKFGITTRHDPVQRWREYPEQYGTLLLPLWTTEEYADSHHDLEQLICTTFDIAKGREWVLPNALLDIYRFIEESDLLVGRLKIWTPSGTFLEPAGTSRATV